VLLSSGAFTLLAISRRCEPSGDMPSCQVGRPFREVEVARVRYLNLAEAQRLLNACDQGASLLSCRKAGKARICTSGREPSGKSRLI
jgi:hypothetical protein